MLRAIGIIATIFTVKDLIKETTEKPAPKGTRFDWDLYWEDIENGVNNREIIKRRGNGYYNTTKPAPPKWYEVPIDTVLDVKRYEYDKQHYSESIVESWRKNGYYRFIKKINKV